MRSLRLRVALAAAVGVFVAVAALGSAAEHIVRHELRASQDRALRGRAGDVARLSASAPALRTSPGALDAPDGGQDLFVEVVDRPGRIVARSRRSAVACSRRSRCAARSRRPHPYGRTRCRARRCACSSRRCPTRRAGGRRRRHRRGHAPRDRAHGRRVRTLILLCGVRRGRRRPARRGADRPRPRAAAALTVAAGRSSAPAILRAGCPRPQRGGGRRAHRDPQPRCSRRSSRPARGAPVPRRRVARAAHAGHRAARQRRLLARHGADPETIADLQAASSASPARRRPARPRAPARSRPRACPSRSTRWPAQRPPHGPGTSRSDARGPSRGRRPRCAARSTTSWPTPRPRGPPVTIAVPRAGARTGRRRPARAWAREADAAFERFWRAPRARAGRLRPRAGHRPGHRRAHGGGRGRRRHVHHRASGRPRRQRTFRDRA